MDKRYLAPLVVVAGVFVLAGGFVHAREWWEVYRDVPSSVPGSAVVKVGFPVNVLASAVAAAALLAAARRATWLTRAVVGGLALQLGSVAALVVSSERSLFGWSEPGYSPAAEQALAVEAGAIVCLVAVLVLRRLAPGARREPAVA